MKKAMLIAPMIILLTVLVIPSQASTTATGTINCSSSAFEGMNFAVQLTDLTVSTDYALFRGTTEVLNFTTSASETERIVYLTAEKDTGKTVMTIYLYTGVNTEVDTKMVAISDIDSFIGLDFLINLGIAIFIAVIIVAIVRKLRQDRS